MAPAIDRLRWVVRLGWVLSIASAAAIVALTTFPTDAPDSSRLHNCFICGERGVADALLNVILFLPLGVSLALAGVRVSRATLAGAVLSGSVEMAQLLVVRGRDASLSDLLFNTVGTALGALLVHAAARWLVPGDRAAARLSLLASMLAALIVGLTGWVLAPSMPKARYFVQWTPDLEGWPTYLGRVERAAIGRLPLERNGNPPATDLRERFERHTVIEVHAVAGPPPPGLAALLRIVTADHREVLLIGPRYGDLVVRYRQRGTDLRLDEPALIVRGAMTGVAAGAPLEVTFYRARANHCITVGARDSCDYGFTAGRAWGLLMFVYSFPEWLGRTLDAGWIAALCLLPGLWARRRWEFGLALAVLAAALVALPPLVDLRPTGPAEYAGALLGLLVGAGARWLAERWGGFGPRGRAPVSTPPP